MDSITSAFSSLFGSGGSGGSGSPLSTILGLGSTGAGLVGNIIGNNEKNSVLKSEINRMNAYNNLTPAQVASGVSSLEQPLNQNLINNVGNAVQGQLGERGLSQAPGIYASTLAQGLAPFQMQEQQMAQQAYFQKLGLPIQAQPSPFGPYPSQTNSSQLLQALFSRGMGTGQQQSVPGGVPSSPAGATPTADYLSNYLTNNFLGNQSNPTTGSGLDFLTGLNGTSYANAGGS